MRSVCAILLCLALPAQTPGKDASERLRARVAGASLELVHERTFAELGLEAPPLGRPEAHALTFDDRGSRVCVQNGRDLATLTVADGSRSQHAIPALRLLGPAPGGVFAGSGSGHWLLDPDRPTAPDEPWCGAATGIWPACIASDGSRIVAGIAWAHLHLRRDGGWRTVQLAEPRTLAVAFDLAAERTAIAFESRGIAILDRDGSAVSTLPNTPSKTPPILAFALDGAQLFVAGDTVRAFAVATGRELASAERRQRFFACIDPVLALGHDGREFTFWDALHLQPVKSVPLDDGNGDVLATALAPSRELLAVTTRAGLRVWRIRA